MNNFPLRQTLLTLTLSSILVTSQTMADDVETITVTANRIANFTGKPMASQIVIDRAQIELAQVQSITELLTRYAGVDIALNGGRGQNASVFIRGASSDQTLVLVDGLRVNSATNGGANWSTISPHHIERIEIVKGPRAAVWGSDAIGGVINIITLKQEAGSAVLSAQVGTHNTQSYALSGGFAHGNGSTTVSVNHESSDGFDVLKSSEEDDDGYDNLSVAFNGTQNVSENLTVKWVLKASDQDSDFDSTYLNRGENENREWQLGAEYNWGGTSSNNIITASFGSSRDRNLTFGGDSNRIKEQGDLFETRRDQFSLVNTTKISDQFSVVVGSDIYDEKVVSTTAFADTERRVHGYFAHGQYNKENLSAEFATRFDDVENIDSETTYNASVGYQVTDNIQVSLLKGTGFKAPTFNDLYFPFGGNPDLLSETSDSEEILVNFEYDNFSVEISGYQNDIQNLIEWAPDADGIWQPRNIADADIQGMDVNLSYQGKGMTHSVSFGYLDAKDGTTDARLDRRAKNQFGYQFMTSFGDTDFLLSYEYKGSRVDRGNTLSSYQVVDVSLNHQFTADFSTQFKVTNLLDEDYETVFDYNTAGTQVYVGLTYQL